MAAAVTPVNNRGIIIGGCGTQQPYAFIADFKSLIGGQPIDMTGSAIIDENTFAATPAAGLESNYHNDPVILYSALAQTTSRIVTPVELESSGEDAFVAEIYPGLQPAPGTDDHRLESMEPFLRRGSGTMPGTKTITISPVVSNILDIQGGTVKTAVAVPDLDAASQPIKAIVGGVATGRYFSFKLLADNKQSVLRFLGLALRGRRIV